MKNFDTLIIIFVLLNIVAALFKKRKQREAQRRKSLTERQQDDVSNAEEMEELDFPIEKEAPPHEKALGFMRDLGLNVPEEAPRGPEEKPVAEEKETPYLRGKEEIGASKLLAPVEQLKPKKSKLRKTSQSIVLRKKHRLFQSKSDLRRAVLLSEVLGLPVSERALN